MEKQQKLVQQMKNDVSWLNIDKNKYSSSVVIIHLDGGFMDIIAKFLNCSYLVLIYLGQKFAEIGRKTLPK
jgi:hypothetical protein